MSPSESTSCPPLAKSIPKKSSQESSLVELINGTLKLFSDLLSALPAPIFRFST
jgi:hypothetical protein